MQKQGFEEYARRAADRDHRFDADAYRFLRDALDHTVRSLGQERANRHVRGPELLAGFRDLALQEFGPLAMTVLDYWGVRRCEDIGDMVFNLVEVGAFGRTQEDSHSDFLGGYDFAEAFQKPFLPGLRAAPPAPRPKRLRRTKPTPNH